MTIYIYISVPGCPYLFLSHLPNAFLQSTGPGPQHAERQVLPIELGIFLERFIGEEMQEPSIAHGDLRRYTHLVHTGGSWASE